MKSPVVKRSIVIAGHKTSVSLEDAFWRSLKEIAVLKGQTLSDVVAGIDHGRDLGNLSSAIRLFVLDHYRDRADRDANSAGPALAHPVSSPRGIEERVENSASGQRRGIG